MSELKKIASFEDAFILFGGLFTFTIWALTTLTTLDLYSKYFVFVFTVALILVTIYFFKNFRIYIRKTEYAVLGFLLFVSLTSFIFFHNSFYGVRDEGVYSNAGMGLVNKGSIYIREFINFPGWISKGNFYIPQFPFGTITWIGINYQIFGDNGLYLINFIPLLVGGLSIFFATRGIIRNRLALLGLLFSFYPMIWFMRRSSSEIIFFSLIWFSFLLLKNIYLKKHSYLYILILCLATLPLIRIDGLLYLFLELFVLVFIFNEKVFSLRFFMVSMLSFLPSVYYYLFLGNTYLNQIISIVNRSSRNVVSQEIYNFPEVLAQNIPNYIYSVLSLYNLNIYIVCVLLSLIWLFREIYINKSQNINLKYFLILILINLPTFYYLFNFSIANDQPWFLRRYVYSILPISVICLVYFIENLFRTCKVVLILLIAINLTVSSPILIFRDYREIEDSINLISKQFNKDSDVLFVDKYAADWYRLATELYFRKGLSTYYLDTENNATYLLQKIDNSRSVYVILNNNTERSLLTENYKLNKVNEIIIKYTTLKSTTDLLHDKFKPNNEILNMPISYVLSLVTIPSEKIEFVGKVSIYNLTLDKR